MIAALFVETNGVYFGLPNVDPWDINRDARFYNGTNAVIAHPPCERWGKLAFLVQAMKGYRVGDDGKAFERALMFVEEFGGVLEHPGGSMAFERYGLATPAQGYWIKTREGFVTQVWQSAYGHRAAKSTWLYVVGLSASQLPSLNWSTPEGTHEIGGRGRIQQRRKSGLVDMVPLKPSLPKKERSATPIAFRDLLISIAEKVNTIRSKA